MAKEYINMLSRNTDNGEIVLYEPNDSESIEVRIDGDISTELTSTSYSNNIRPREVLLSFYYNY